MLALSKYLIEHFVSSTKAFKRAIGYSVRVLTQEDTEHMAINVKPLSDRVDPHADRYGHREGVNLTTLMPGSYDHVVAASHCDRYGHVEGNDPRQKVADEAIVVN